MEIFISSNQATPLSDNKKAPDQPISKKGQANQRWQSRLLIGMLLILLSASLAVNFFFMQDNKALQQAHDKEILRADSLISAKLHVEKQLRLARYGSVNNTNNSQDSLFNQLR